jgi:hypothetical protein
MQVSQSQDAPYEIFLEKFYIARLSAEATAQTGFFSFFFSLPDVRLVKKRTSKKQKIIFVKIY